MWRGQNDNGEVMMGMQYESYWVKKNGNILMRTGNKEKAIETGQQASLEDPSAYVEITSQTLVEREVRSWEPRAKRD